MSTQIICGNNIELLKQYPDNYFDSIVTDAPYGLGKEPDAVELMKNWVEKGYHEISGTGFMGKDWDAFVPQPLFWKEAFRVLKHGGHVLSFFGTRTYDWGVMAMRFAGFEVRDTITWHYGSGFPKSHNIGKAIDKIQGNEREVVGEQSLGYKDENHSPLKVESGWNNNSLKNTFDLTKGQSEWEGWGSALKPASEPIVLARKPLEKGLSIAENVLKWSVGGINIDGCRVGSQGGCKNEMGSGISETVNTFGKIGEGVCSFKKGGLFGGLNDVMKTPIDGLGRFPANVVFSHHEDCVCNGTKKVKAIKGGNSRAIQKNTYNDFGKNYDNTPNGIGCGFGDEDGNEEVEDWDCVEDCPIRILDEQSGILKSGDIKPYKNKTVAEYSQFHSLQKNGNFKGDKGGASRFFYTAKSSKGERNKGLDEFEEKSGADITGRKEGSKGLIMDGRVNNPYAGASATFAKTNFHPTVKPIKLMQYLVRLITPPNGIVLDPFNGSGTTGIAAKLEGLNYVGLELDPEYCKISEARIAAWEIEKPENNNQLSLF